jgi:hypothetical protein
MSTKSRHIYLFKTNAHTLSREEGVSMNAHVKNHVQRWFSHLNMSEEEAAAAGLPQEGIEVCFDYVDDWKDDLYPSTPEFWKEDNWVRIRTMSAPSDKVFGAVIITVDCETQNEDSIEVLFLYLNREEITEP